ncbi:MAG: rhodanese-like domain-containing protein [Gammaproteobacteria bacterium]|nr:rhodanese-like domain-containing protein [Gammaproteobacteria bacterium]
MVFLLIVGCSGSESTSLAEISPQQASKIVASDNAVIIDVRTQEEWDAGHIPGAVHIPLSDVKSRLDDFKTYEGKTLVMQCRSGKRSAKAANILLDAGFNNVSNLKGGIMAWKKEKLPVE